MEAIDRRFILKVAGVILCCQLLVGCKAETPIGKWQDGIIPYYLSGDFTTEEMTTIERAMAEWEKVTDVHFIEVTPRASAYHIIKVNENSWSSSVGENNSHCKMIFGSGGDTYSHVLHELGHALGLLHEHQRPDRDQFVRVIWSNLMAQFFVNYEKQDNPLIKEEQYNYDFSSIMHYPANSFSIDGISNTIESLDEDQPIKRSDTLTTTDVQKAVEIYGLPVEE
jgi:hypothetical protein